MKKLLLLILLCAGTHSIAFAFSNDKEKRIINEETSLFEIEASATTEYLNIILNNPQAPVEVKIIDKSGYIRIQKKLHLDTQIDISILRNGLYLIKVYAGNQMAVKRFYKGPDWVDIK